MTSYDKEFLSIFNEYYPFERYILKNPKPINNTFDDALLLELFVPETEIKPIVDDNGSLITYTSINLEEIYVKIKGPAGVMRFGYFDFSSTVREDIRIIFIEDFGQYEYESLYVDHEGDNNEDLKELLTEQFFKIKEVYGNCKIKKDSVRSNLIVENALPTTSNP